MGKRFRLGVKNVKVLYNVNETKWSEPKLYDLVESMNNDTLIYKFWIESSRVVNGTRFKVRIEDFYGNTSCKSYIYIINRRLIPVPTLSNLKP